MSNLRLRIAIADSASVLQSALLWCMFVPVSHLLVLLLIAVQGEPLALQLQKVIQAGDSYRAAEIMARAGDAQTVARGYSEVTRELYRKLRDLPAFIVVSRQGIEYLLSRAAEIEKTDPALAVELRGAAKTLAYNLASNMWPGWNESGIRITEREIEVGLEAARLNLRLGIELKRGPEPLFNAHWIIGALELAHGHYAEAIQSYEQSQRIAAEARLRSYELLAAGSIAIAKIVGNINVIQGERELSQAKTSLTSENLNDGKFFADQLDTAYQVFRKR